MDNTTLAEQHSVPDSSPNTLSPQKAERLYYMDWLRVIAFSLLIVVHSAEVFSNWKFYINNNETSVAIGYILKFFAQWRMPLLFIISGAAVVLSLKNRSAIKFLKERFIRILIPLIAGMLLVIPPQIYFVWLSNGYDVGFWDFYKTLFDFQWYPKGNFHWLHLWYLAFIFAYTVAMLPFILSSRSEKGKAYVNRIGKFISKPVLLFSIPVIMALPYYYINSIAPNGNLSQLFFYFPYFVFGIFFINNVHIRQAFASYKKAALVLACITVTMLYLLVWIKDGSGNTYLSPDWDKKSSEIGLMILTTLNEWFWLIVIWGYAIKYLNRGSKALSYANQAVFPFYIFHQTVIVIISYYVIQLDASILTKFSMVLSSTVIFIWILYEVILKRTIMTRAMFGIKI